MSGCRCQCQASLWSYMWRPATATSAPWTHWQGPLLSHSSGGRDGGSFRAGFISRGKTSEGENFAPFAKPKAPTASRTHCTAKAPGFRQHHLPARRQFAAKFIRARSYPPPQPRSATIPPGFGPVDPSTYQGKENKPPPPPLAAATLKSQSCGNNTYCCSDRVLLSQRGGGGGGKLCMLVEQ